MKTNPLFLFFAALCASVFGAHAEEHPAPRYDPFFYTSDQFIKGDDGQSAFMGTGRPNKTHSQIPHLPFYSGYMNTNYTYRFVNVMEQVLTLVGEGKHGLWRVQDNGTVREYLKNGASGLRENADLNATDNFEKIVSDYSNFISEEGSGGYKYPSEKVNKDGSLNFIDLPITHPKYQGKYSGHKPIELALFYCTMSEGGYPYAREAMNFAFNQRGANTIGPLGQRAGIDISENYTKVIRLNHFPDAKSWINTGQAGRDDLHVKWQAVDIQKTRAEYYLVERPFFNVPYLFIAAVYDNKSDSDFRYVRPEGPYYDAIKNKFGNLKTVVTQAPRFHIQDGQRARVVGLPLYGVHHPNRDAYGGGGACPLKGGDFADYPKTTGGAGWPTNYEEVTPLCDGVLVDIKFYSNLDGRDWNDPGKYLANAGVGTETVTYKLKPGEYGVFSDPYNSSRSIKNPESQNLPDRITLTYPSVDPAVSYVPPPQLEVGSTMIPTASTSCRPMLL